MAQSRFCYFDNVKALLIVLVVIGHMIDPAVVADHKMARALFVFIYAFHMPLFIFLSGLFCNLEKLTSRKALHRITFYLVLGFIAKLIILLIPTLVGKPISFSLLSDGGIPWFLFALAAFYTLAYCLRHASSKTVLAMAVVLGLLVGYDSNVGDYLYLSRIVVFFPFFWLGVMLKPQELETLFRNKVVRAAGIAAIVLFAAYCIMCTSDIYPYRGLFAGRNSYQAVAIENCSFVNRFVAYAISVVTCFGVLALMPHARVPFVSNMGERTLPIYLLHYQIVQILGYSGCLAFFAALPGSGWMLLIPLAVVIAFCLSVPVLSKPFDLLNASLDVQSKEPSRQGKTSQHA